MFENEGTDIESTQSDVTDSSSESQSDNQPVQQEAASQAQKEVPFHEHPRWKEVMEERNAERQRSQALERQLQEMQRQFQDLRKPEPQQDKMYERLKGIDPEFADYLKEAREQAALAKQLQSELQSIRQEQFVNQAVGKFEELTKASQVSPELADLYKAQLDLAYREGKIKSVSDLERSYNEMHSRTQKFLQAQERAAIEKYTASMTKDAKAPAAQGKSKAPTQAGKIEFSKNPQEAKAQLIKHIAGSLRAGRDI